MTTDTTDDVRTTTDRAPERGPVTMDLQQTFFRVVHGEESDYDAWLEHV
jgi:hypothetical protein